MSWNLLIYRVGEDEEEAMPLGNLTLVREAVNSVFPDLQWPSATECGLYVAGGFSIEWAVVGEEVRDGYTNGGYNHLKELAEMCKKMRWRVADAQEGEDLDLDDPYALYGGEGDE